MKATALLALGAAAFSSGAHAQYLWQARDAAQARDGAHAAAQPSALPQQGTGGGLMIFIDPVTRQIRPAEQDDFRALLPPRLAPEAIPAPQPFVTRDGAIGVHLDPSFDSYMVAVRRADGTLVLDCIEGHTPPAAARPANATGVGPAKTNARLDEK